MEIREMEDDLRSRIKTVITNFASDGLRTLCLAYADIDGEVDWSEPPEGQLICLGVVGIKVSVNTIECVVAGAVVHFFNYLC